MSIIEKAVDKLRSEDQFGKKPDDREYKAPLSPPLSSDINSQNKKSCGIEAAQKEPVSTVDESSSASTQEPDINIKALNLDGLITTQSGRTRLSEEMRMIKRPILLKAFGKGSRPSDHANLLMITSAVAGEGKTFTSLNLALSIATEMDRTVLVVDADLARPGLSRLLHVSDKPGLTDHLMEENSDLGEILLRTDIPKLTILPAGRKHGHATELLASNSMKSLFNELALRYPDRIVLFDSPPLLVTSEAGVLASVMGQIALVIESARTPQYLVKEALALLDSTDNVSLILNKCKKSILSARLTGYGYGYGESYGSEGDK